MALWWGGGGGGAGGKIPACGWPCGGLGGVGGGGHLCHTDTFLVSIGVMTA